MTLGSTQSPPSDELLALQARTRYVRKTGCLLWTGPVSKEGYPYVEYHGKQMHAMKAVWLAAGRKITKGKRPVAACGHQLCVWIAHAVEIARTARRPSRPGAHSGPRVRTLRHDQVRNIRASSEKPETIAKRYGVTPNYVLKIKRGARKAAVA